eukprot:391448-Rhodomonas_salina.3
MHAGVPCDKRAPQPPQQLQSQLSITYVIDTINAHACDRALLTARRHCGHAEHGPKSTQVPVVDIGVGCTVREIVDV